MCAKRGNARAVAALIQYGADISKGVLHTIVEESVLHPDKTKGLLNVYKTVVDNCVTWRCLEERSSCPLKDTPEYREKRTQTMLSLTTYPYKEDNLNMLERALEYKAIDFVDAIVNTEGVYREFHPASVEKN